MVEFSAIIADFALGWAFAGLMPSWTAAITAGRRSSTASSCVRGETRLFGLGGVRFVGLISRLSDGVNGVVALLERRSLNTGRLGSDLVGYRASYRLTGAGAGSIERIDDAIHGDYVLRCSAYGEG